MTDRRQPSQPAGGRAGQREREFEGQRGLSENGELAEPALTGKTFLRMEEFRAQRGLDNGAEERSLDDGAGRSPYLAGALEKETLAAEAPTAAAPTWHSLGPAGIPNGQTYGSRTTTVAGRVAAIAVDPADSKHLLVGAAAGGVWESRDTGSTWAPRTDDQLTLSIGALAFDPGEPSTVYAGTGEGNWAYARLGQGVLRSADGGSTWSVLARDFFSGFGFYGLLVDPADGKRLIAATTGGAVVSTDSGESWSVLHNGRSWDVSLGQPGGEQEILIAALDGLFVAKGGGAPTRVSLPGLPASLDRRRDRMAVAHVPTDPGQAFVFAASGGQPHLWHRRAIDQPFEPLPLPSLKVGKRLALRVDQAPYDWYVAVPARSDDVIYLGAIELVKGQRHHANWSWDDVSSRQGDGDSIHPDQHTMAFDPQDPDVIYAGNDGGVFRSPDGGGSWSSLNAGLAISEVEYLTQRPDGPTWIMAGLQDNGTVRRDKEGEWEQVALGDGGDCATDMAKPDTCFSSYVYMYLYRSRRGGNRDSWEEITPAEEGEFAMLFYPPLEVNGELVVKAGEVVCLSADSGDSWEKIQLPPNAAGEASIATAVAVPSTAHVVVGTRWGDVFRIEKAAAGWGAPVKLTTPLAGWISDLAIDPDLPHRIWATFSSPGKVLRSDDDGGSWSDVTANLPPIPVNAIVTDPADRDRVWVACDVGVFESGDAGGSWSMYGTGLPNALAEDLLFYEPDRLLRVGTRSRGVWETSV